MMPVNESRRGAPRPGAPTYAQAKALDIDRPGLRMRLDWDGMAGVRCVRMFETRVRDTTGWRTERVEHVLGTASEPMS